MGRQRERWGEGKSKLVRLDKDNRGACVRVRHVCITTVLVERKTQR